jgi:AraC family transcriptional regulator, regulatory protein of adaptative response / methylated-DNA-[protein]-cysteine methyltransferase
MNPTDYIRIEKAIRYLADHFAENPSLNLLAREAGLSPFHFQRLFRRWAGVSPKQFAQYLSAQTAKQKILESKNILDATFKSGLTSPGRLHDLLVSVEAMTPGDYKNRGRDIRIEYGTYPSPFGECLIAQTPRGICWLSFLAAGGMKSALADLKRRWPESVFRENKSRATKTGKILFGRKAAKDGKLNLVLRGTPFQLKVWEALLRVPEKALVSYGVLARSIGKPGASRAVGTAVGQNPISYLIPCHRVIRETGVLGNYRWGSARKKAIVGWESAQS